MAFLIDKILIFLFCLLPVLKEGIVSLEVCGALTAVIILCGGQVLIYDGTGDKTRRIAKNFSEILFCVICLFCPYFLTFLPAAVYEAVRTKDIPALIFCGFTLTAGLIMYGSTAAYPLLICLFAAYCCHKTLINLDLKHKSRKARDDSTELEKIMRLRNRELKENIEYEIKITTLKERNRIAREIHDNVGHLLSRSLLQTGALSAICPKEQVALKSGLEDLKDSLNSAMNSIRESVHDLRDNSLDLKNEAEKIILPLKTRFFVDFDFDIAGEAPPKIKLCFISILKEAVNNIIRHSSGDKVSVIMREHPSMYQLIVYDNGKARLPKITEGMGISDMKERAEAIGGIFSINSENGFTVFLSVRKEEQ